MQFLEESTQTIKTRVQSTHISKKKYNCYINYNPNSIGYSGISLYFCERANGLHTINEQ